MQRAFQTLIMKALNYRRLKMSIIEKTEVKLKGRVVEVVDVEKFDTVDEALASLGEETTISLINRQHKADTCNAARAKHRPSTASKKKLRQLAFELCTPERDAELHAELMAKMGDFDALMEFLDSLADRVREEILAGSVVVDDDDNDNDE